ncbi:MAG TPA: MFS transporter, partial [Candidatus Kapabacteria bacterium]|nr:MFS transporter [Candidatus Kapabacteria bacterium]
MAEEKKKVSLKDFPPMFWLVVLFEFFERGSYYGMMSILSVYLTDQLNFTKESVGLIKSTIQPLLYFLPILAGAIADRMGYRRTLTVAFSLLGIGYFLTSQTTAYSAVFFSLVIMGLGAGTFKPIISGTIAKVTDENTSSVGFGIFYWSINLGAFLFPMFLVPYLKSMDWSYVMIASAIFTGAMVIPTLLFFREPKREEKPKESLGTAIKEIFSKIAIVFMDWRFILF